MPVHAVLPRLGEKDGKEWMTGGFVKMQEKKEQLETSFFLSDGMAENMDGISLPVLRV